MLISSSKLRLRDSLPTFMRSMLPLIKSAIYSAFYELGEHNVGNVEQAGVFQLIITLSQRRGKKVYDPYSHTQLPNLRDRASTALPAK